MATTQRPVNRTSNNGNPQRKRRKKKKNDNYLYIGVSLLLIALVLVAVIIFIAVGCDENEDENSKDNSSTAAENSTAVSDDISKSENNVWQEESNITEGSGWKTENGNTYYIDENGNKFTGVNSIGGSIYVFDDNGAMQKGFVTVGEDIYYLGDNGAAAIGWLELGSETYYFKENGKAAIGEKEIDGKKHFFSAKGKEFIVANPWNEVSDQVEDLVRLPAAYGHDTKGLVSRKIYDALIKMMDDGYRATGCNLYVISGHRTYAYQQNNFNNEVNSYRSMGYSDEEARRLAAEWVAVPGTSEHHLGLAVDIIDTASWALDESQENLEGQKWLMENSWKYGFLFRYPKGTKGETGINYEPWHYRYLGEELAKEVHDSGLTLEGYIKSITKD